MKQKRQLAILGGLLVVAGLVWYFAYFRGDKPSGDSGNVAAARSYKLLAIDNPELHWPELERARKTEYKGKGNPFSKEAPTPAHDPVKSAAPSRPQGPPPPPVEPPPALPANLKFFGYGVVPNGTSRRAFFSDGEDVFIVSEGETLLGRFRILKVNNTNLEFEEIPTGRRNTAPLVEEQAGQPNT
jgi:hypothetical protein